MAVTEPTEDFAAMFEASLKAKRIERGQTIEGTIVAIGPEVAFVDVGGKGEATLSIDELRDDDGNLEAAVGDRIHAVVVSTAGGLTLSRKLARGAATQRQIEEAFRSGLPVEGKVVGVVKGGYEVRVARQRAFCPGSQIDILRTEPAAHEGRVYTFRIIEYKEGGRNLIVSRRVLLEEEQRAKAAEVRKSIVPGAVMEGRVASVRDFGAFIDLGGGVQGLLHVSEMPWSRTEDKAMKPGDEVTVKVLAVDEDKQKISLGMSSPPGGAAAQPDIVAGMRLVGKVERHERFGVFVFLAPGRTGLMPTSETGVAKDGDIPRAFPVGSDVEVIVLEVSEPPGRRIRLSAKAVRDAREAEEVRQYNEREGAPNSAFGSSLADKLRGALEPRKNN
jgi:small subunit ribosomal protein S1